MQQSGSDQIWKRRMAQGAGAVAWTVGLLLAGSDGPMMPYINLLGVILFAGISLWLGQQLAQAGSLKEPWVQRPEKAEKPRSMRPAQQRKPGLVSGNWAWDRLDKMNVNSYSNCQLVPEHCLIRSWENFKN